MALEHGMDSTPDVDVSSSEEIPTFSQEEIAEIREVTLPQIRRDVQRLLDQYNNLREYFSDEFEKVEEQHPHLAEKINNVAIVLSKIGEDNENLTNEEIMGFIHQYNFLARQINRILQNIEEDETKDDEEFLASAAYGDLNLDDLPLTEEQRQLIEDQQEELTQFAEALLEELFDESYVDRFVRWTTGQRELDGYQRILLAPANGIESVVGAVISLAKPDTYRDLFSTIQYATSLSYEDWCSLWRGVKFTFREMKSVDIAAHSISLIVSFAMLGLGCVRLVQFAKAAGCSAKTIAAINTISMATTTRSVPSVRRAAPLAIMTGITLPYIGVESERKSSKSSRRDSSSGLVTPGGHYNR